jgi:hypothetical protein
MAGRPCAYEGCKAWAKKDSPWCIAHPEGKPRRIGGGRKGNQNARTHGAYAAYVPIVALEEALKLPAGDLRLEIAVMRGMFQELMRSELSLEETIKRAETITGALVRLLRANKALGDEQEGAMEEMLRRVLGADGLGGG